MLNRYTVLGLVMLAVALALIVGDGFAAPHVPPP